MWRRSGSALSQRLALSEEVAEALYGRAKRPVVALESTIISHGMPFPQNLQMAQHVEEIVRAHGACPATICIAEGALKVGLGEKDLAQLAELGAGAKKCSTRDIAATVTDKKVVGATTVSSTMRIAHAAGIKVFVTGGIGGVHRFCEETMDISTDLMELSRTPVAVVCAGIKSILDIPRTLEFLETHSVPVIGYRTDQFPAFFTQDSGEKAHLRRDTPQDIARLIHESEALELPNGHIIAVPNPKPVPTEVINEAIELGLKEVVEKNIHGQAVTPYLLKRVNEITQGVSLTSNIDLVNNNATVGSQVACALFDLENGAVVDPTTKTEYSIPVAKKSSSTKSGDRKRVLVVGGLVLDIISSSASPLIRGTSNIGTIKQSSGGVGRNIAECLHRLRLDPLLVSSVGNDAPGSVLLENLKKLGLDTSGITVSDKLATAVYSAVLDSTGDMDAAIADMSAFESIESSSISDKTIDKANLIVADGNLTPRTIGDLFKRSARLGVDTWFEPTSVQKALHVVEGDGVSWMKYMSPNADELHAISQAIRQKLEDANVSSESTDERFPLTKESGIIPKEEMTQLKNDLITALLAMANGDTKQSKHVLVTLGKHGVLVASINVSIRDLREVVDECGFPVDIWGMHHVHGGHSVTMVHLPGVEILVTNCTGAGDSMVGGTIYGLLEGYDIFQSCHMGMIAARQSLASEHAISPNLAPQILYSAS
ncbi:hypothetical protein PHYSODRAFT_343685 [Phytophthora sojae]|uniref:Carbohydrate kinase PfkB domain-containing protein n=1 Tax=Phytophthora sojae (strain P6497) TaxID=1094619 RepID=G4YPF6_PHYSP|nr:hypothetical protein PHYSODRAFT_343685 [Phytophthora sojae]EGZ27936.1 hypothetical protein PHYSODRAFT_343685 [Phytophthora sojae]|eukprot:XP_009515211.1 hypothetical protein PHYSODRAFT_343685 [Phytophthora sojae]